MDAQRVDMYIQTNADKLPAERVEEIRQRLLTLDENKFNVVTATELKSPIIMLVISWFLGGFGVDRFMLGYSNWWLKLITCAGLGIWGILDLIKMFGMTKEYNYQQLLKNLQ